MSEYKKNYTEAELDYAKRVKDFAEKIKDFAVGPGIEFYSYYNNAMSAAMCRDYLPSVEVRVTKEGLKKKCKGKVSTVRSFQDPIEKWADFLGYEDYVSEYETAHPQMESWLKALKERFEGRLKRADSSEVAKKRQEEEDNIKYALKVKAFAKVARILINDDEEVHLLKESYSSISDHLKAPDHEILITTKGLEVRELGSTTKKADYDGDSWLEVLPSGSERIRLLGIKNLHTTGYCIRSWSEIKKKCLSRALKNLENILMERT